MTSRLSVERAARLLDAYRGLLTERQREVASLVYENDWSLAEVALVYGTSRAAVADIVARSGRQLEEWEQSLGLVAHRLQVSRIATRLVELAQQVDDASLGRALELLVQELREAEGADSGV